MSLTPKEHSQCWASAGSESPFSSSMGETYYGNAYSSTSTLQTHSIYMYMYMQVHTHIHVQYNYSCAVRVLQSTHQCTHNA